MPLPSTDFDPTEACIPWKVLKNSGYDVVVATPDAKAAQCDLKTLSGDGLGPFAGILAANHDAREVYAEFSRSREFLNPISWEQIQEQNFDAILCVGGHAPGMREYLESPILHKVAVGFMEKNKIIAAICHGVVLLARSHAANSKSILFEKKVTALNFQQEMMAWFLTFSWMGNYYRTYRMSVEEEVIKNLGSKKYFIRGPVPLLRDAPEHLSRGFSVVDGNLITARWPGDAYNFSQALLRALESTN